MADNDFDNKEFNAEFEKSMLKQKQIHEQQNKMKLDKLNKVQDKKIYDYTLSQTLINMKDAIFDIMDDIITLNITKDILTKENRLYYLGILILIIVLVLHVYDLLHYDKRTDLAKETSQLDG